MSVLESLAPEILEEIAVHVALTPFLGPPSNLISLLCTSRKICDALSYSNNKHLYAEIFRVKFDCDAVSRRFGPRWLTTTCFAVELRKRFSALKRIKSGVDLQNSHVDDMWTAYLMMLESDGRNECQLVEWACLRQYVLRVILYRAQVSVGSTSLWYGCTQGTSLALWLLWMTDNRETLQQEDLRAHNGINNLLHPFIVRGYLHPSFHGPDSHFSLPLCAHTQSPAPHCSGPPPSVAHLTHYSHNLDIAAPSLAIAVLLCYSVRVEAHMDVSSLPQTLHSLPPNRAAAHSLGVAGPTLEDVLTFHCRVRTNFWQGSTSEIASSQANDEDIPTGSERRDEDWYRLVSCLDLWSDGTALRGIVYTPGALSGTWQGHLTVPHVEAYYSSLVNPRQPAASVSVGRHPLYCRLREHHCLNPDVPLRPGNAPDGWGDDILNAWLPRDLSFKTLEDALEIYDPMSEKTVRYETYFPDRPSPYSWNALARLESPRVESEQPTGINADYCHSHIEDRSVGVDVSYIDDDDAWEDTVEHESSGVTDILVTGETSDEDGEAWGHYKFIGRVRAWDGLVVLLRIPQTPNLGRWIFKGYFMNGVFAGRWRETDTSVEITGMESGFVLCKSSN